MSNHRRWWEGPEPWEKDAIIKAMIGGLDTPRSITPFIPFGPIHASPLDLEREILRELTEIRKNTARIALHLELRELPPLQAYLDRLRRNS